MVLDSIHRHSLRPAPPLAKFALLLMVTAALMAAGFCSSPAAAQTVSSGDATLSALSVSPKDIIGFDGGRTSYEVGVDSSVTQATVSATANDDAATVDIAPPDAVANVEGHQVDLSAGRNAVAVTVTAENGSTQDYTVSVNQGVTDSTGWQAGADLDGLIAADNDDPRGIWSDGTIIWVADASDDKLYAYNLSDGLRDDIRDITLDADNGDPQGIWSNGTIVWVADTADDKLYAYNLSDGMRDDGRDITLVARNDRPSGIWSDGTTIWVADRIDRKLYAYLLSDGMRDNGRDITLTATNDSPQGIWSDRTTIWVADLNVERLYAYRLSDGMRDGGGGHQNAGCGRQYLPVWHLVGRDDHVGCGLVRRQALRLHHTVALGRQPERAQRVPQGHHRIRQGPNVVRGGCGQFGDPGHRVGHRQ